MKITIETTEHEKHNVAGRRVVIEQGNDDMTVMEFVQVIRQAMLAWGFHPDNVRKLLDEE